MGLIGQTYCELRAPSEWALKSKNNNTQMKLKVNIVGKKGYQDRFSSTKPSNDATKQT